MTARRMMVVVLSASWLLGGTWAMSVLAQEQGGQPMYPPPQQMTPYGSPTYGEPASGNGSQASVYGDPSSISGPATNSSSGTPPPNYGNPGTTIGTSPYPSNPPTPPTPGQPGQPMGDNSVAQSLYDYRAAPGGANAQAYMPSTDVNAFVERNLHSNEPWSWQQLPTGLLYKSYLAGGKEPRIGSQWVHERNQGWLWDVALGGRVGLLRYGTDNDLWPQGWQLDIEGAAFPRMNLEYDRDVDSVDFRAGMLLTSRQGPWEFKIGYYHLSSHLGDEYMIRNPSSLASRINYVRESSVAGLAFYPHPSLRLYSEAGWAFYTDGGAKPWEFQFGADFSSPEPTGFWGAPFFAINAHLRQENDFGGNMTVQSGLQWRGRTGHLFRVGMQYFNGMSDQYQFFDRFEEQIGLGLWYDY